MVLPDIAKYCHDQDGSVAYPSSQQTEEGSEAAEQPSAEQSSADYAAQWEQYNQYWTQYAAWQQWYAAQAQQAPQPPPAAAAPEGRASDKHKSILVGNMKEAVPNKSSLDYEALNQNYLDRSEELWCAVEESRWSTL